MKDHQVYNRLVLLLIQFMIFKAKQLTCAAEVSTERKVQESKSLSSPSKQ